MSSPTEMAPWRNRLTTSFDQMRRELDDTISSWFSEGGNGLSGFSPQMNLAETDTGYEVTVDLPGLKPEEVKVELHGDQLIVSGERKEESEVNDKRFHRIERRYGSFCRSLTLAQPVKADTIDARFENGVLNITATKAEPVMTRQIKVHN